MSAPSVASLRESFALANASERRMPESEPAAALVDAATTDRQ